MPINDNDQDIDGGINDCSHHDAPKHTVSRDIVSFSLRCAWNDEVGHSENGYFIPDVEQPYPQGVWRFSLRKTDKAAEMEMHCDTADVHFQANVESASLLRLQELIEARGIAKLNGHEKWDSAVGELLDLNIAYASGESIHVYAEGGSSTLPEQDWSPLWFLEFFHDLARVDGKIPRRNS